MSYRWEPASGTFDEHELDEVGFRKDFDSQEAAEEWLSLFFDDLVDIEMTLRQRCHDIDVLSHRQRRNQVVKLENEANHIPPIFFHFRG